MMAAEVLNDLTAFVARKLPGVTVSGATSLQRDVPFDSLDRMELLVRIEKNYGVAIAPEEYVERHLEILQNLAAFIAERCAARQV